MNEQTLTELFEREASAAPASTGDVTTDLLAGRRALRRRRLWQSGVVVASTMSAIAVGSLAVGGWPLTTSPMSPATDPSSSQSFEDLSPRQIVAKQKAREYVAVVQPHLAEVDGRWEESTCGGCQASGGAAGSPMMYQALEADASVWRQGEQTGVLSVTVMDKSWDIETSPGCFVDINLAGPRCPSLETIDGYRVAVGQATTDDGSPLISVLAIRPNGDRVHVQLDGSAVDVSSGYPTTTGIDEFTIGIETLTDIATDPDLTLEPFPADRP